MGDEMRVEEWEKVIDVNMTGGFLGGKGGMGYMMDDEMKGCILNIWSVDEEIGGGLNVE